MKRRYAILIGSMIFLLLSLCACGQAKNKDRESPKDKLGEEPTLILVDVLSSQANNIQLSASSYSWNVDKGLGQMESTIACGAASLEFAGMDMITKIKMPQYNGMEGVMYSVSGEAGPDILTVNRWDNSAIGDPDAEPQGTKTYTYPNLLVELLPGSVYEFNAEWLEENLGSYGAYGEASFVMVTE